MEDAGLALDSCRPCYLLWFDGGELEGVATEPVRPRLHEARPIRSPRSRDPRGLLEEWSERNAPERGWQRICGYLGLPYEEEENPTGTAYATVSIALLLILAHFLVTREGLYEVAREWGFVPALAGRHLGATWLTTFFLHGGWLHLFGNAYFLVAFGDNVEKDLGVARYLLLLLLGTTLGVALHYLFDPSSERPLIGASAGISALLLYYAYRFPAARIGWALRYGFIPVWWFRMRAHTAFAVWLVFQLGLVAFQATGRTSVSAMAHLGGVGAGVLFVWFQRVRAAPSPATASREE
ncbi:MAG: rhomboid family intramembrane serine protease [Planctomycetes bacterium]|nr:rhomboid family intramembrane serine protease [Planctomycetota bacterium]